MLSFEDAAKYIEPSIWPEVKAKAEIAEFFGALVDSGHVPPELAPKDWSRFADNVYRLVASQPRRPKPRDIAVMVRRDLQAELDAIGPGAVPRSISLWQLTFASLFKARSVPTSLVDHWPLVTSELEDLYPAMRGFSPRFDYS